MKYFFLLFIASASFIAQKTNSVKQFHWLEGTWKLENKEVYENWQMSNDTMMTGVGYNIMEKKHGEELVKEMVTNESMRLVAREKNFFYIPSAAGQNKGEEVEFEIVSFSKNSFVAENRKHDFPQRIAYRLENEKTLYAFIEGKQNGRKKKIDYFFIRVK